MDQKLPKESYVTSVQIDSTDRESVTQATSFSESADDGSGSLGDDEDEYDDEEDNGNISKSRIVRDTSGEKKPHRKRRCQKRCQGPHK